MDKAAVVEALKAANAVAFEPAPASGCGRAYVTLSMGKDRATVNAVAAGCKSLGLLFQRKGYRGLTNAIYIGYDNADGRALGKAKAFAAELTKRGIPAYDDAQED